MCSYDTLICPCPVIRDWVRIDQTQSDCSREHDCLPDQDCPNSGYFLEVPVQVSVAPQRAVARLTGLLLQRL